MSHSEPTNPAPIERPQLIIKIGGLKVIGAGAAAVLLVLLGLLVVLLIYIKPTLRMSLSAALWVGFVLYWSAAARRAAPTQSAESRASRRLHQILMNGALLLLFIPVPGLRHRFLPAGLFLVVTGLALQAAFALLAVWARRHLGRNWSGAITVAVDHDLVRSGPYRFVRHPIYSAMLGMFLGTTVVSGEWHALVALALIAVAYWRKIGLEERSLRGVFGPAYDAYRRETWALVPGVF